MTNLSPDSDNKYEKVAILSILGGTGLIAALVGCKFGLSSAKKLHKHKLEVELPLEKIHREGTQLAFRALRWGTLLSILGVGSICASVLLATGAKNSQDFNSTLSSWFPHFPKKPSQGRNEFESVKDLVEYIISEDETNKKHK